MTSALDNGGDVTILATAAANPLAGPGGVLCGVLCMVGVVVGVLVAGMAEDDELRLPMAAAATEAASSLTFANVSESNAVGGSVVETVSEEPDAAVVADVSPFSVDF